FVMDGGGVHIEHHAMAAVGLVAQPVDVLQILAPVATTVFRAPHHLVDSSRQAREFRRAAYGGHTRPVRRLGQRRQMRDHETVPRKYPVTIKGSANVISVKMKMPCFCLTSC